jgi:isopentenyldiphosphate isomerase
MMGIDNTIEILDLVDEDDQIIGQLPRGEVYARGLSNFRSINGFIRNNNNQLWIPRRTEKKRIFPGGLDIGVAGHVEAGETYLESFLRECEEEINVSRGEIKFKVLGHLNPHLARISSFMMIYEIKLDEAPQYNKDDFQGYQWLTPGEAKAMIKTDAVAPKGDLLTLLRIFYPEG